MRVPVSWWKSCALGLLTVLTVMVGALPALAQFSCRADVDRTTTVVGGTVVLTVKAQGSIAGSVDFRLPSAIEPLVAGTSDSRSRIATGGQSRIIISRSFFITPRREGKLEIGPIVVSDANSRCRTDSLTITVTQASAAVPPGNSRRQSGAGAEQLGGRPGDDIFITLEVDRDEAWVGQQLILTFRYFHRISPWNNPQFQAPRTAGFWREELGGQRDFRTTVRGRSYDVAEIRYALFPTRAGELVIEPAELSFPNSGLDRYFSTRRRRGPRVLRTDPITVTVKDLPADRPADFSGLVASRVQLAAQTNRDTVPRGEPVDYQVRLVSDAFLKTFDGLQVPAVADVRVHDAGDDFRTALENERLLGQVTVEKVLVPQKEGPTELPVVSLVWFDSGSGRFRTATAGVPPVMVTPSDNPYPDQEDSGFLRSQISRLGQDLVFIHNVPDHLRRRSAVLVHQPLWWAALLLPVLLLAGWRLYLARRLSDPVVLRRRAALGRALGRLKEAAAQEDGHAVARAITGYVADRTNRPVASIAAAEVQAHAGAQGCPDTGRRLARILEICDLARYGGESLAEGPGALAREVETLLPKLERGGKNRGAQGPLTVLAFLLLSLGAGAPQVLAETDPARLMAEGNQVYTEGQVEAARDLYRQAIALGAEDPDLYYNLGNAHARLGELGHAVACYLRAQRLAPRDRDIRENLAWVRGSIQDLELSEQEMPLFIAQFVAVIKAFTLGQWAVLLVLLVWGLAGVLAWQAWRGSWADNLRRLVLALGALTLLVAVIVFWRWRSEEVRQTAVVVVGEEAVRSGPDDSFPVQFQVHDGLTIRIAEERRGWVRIDLGAESPAAQGRALAAPSRTARMAFSGPQKIRKPSFRLPIGCGNGQHPILSIGEPGRRPTDGRHGFGQEQPGTQRDHENPRRLAKQGAGNLIPGLGNGGGHGGGRAWTRAHASVPDGAVGRSPQIGAGCRGPRSAAQRHPGDQHLHQAERFSGVLRPLRGPNGPAVVAAQALDQRVAGFP